MQIFPLCIAFTVLLLQHGCIDDNVSEPVDYFVPDRTISTTFERIAMKFCIDVHVPARMNPTDFGDPLIWLIAPP